MTKPTLLSQLLRVGCCSLTIFSISGIAFAQPGNGNGNGGGGGRGEEPPLNIAFASADSKGIVLFTSDGTSQRLTRTKGRARDVRAVYSPDGSLIAFKRHPDLTVVDQEIYTISRDGRNQTLIRSLSFGSDPVPETVNDTLLWSPDGSRIVYPTHDQVWALGLDGTLELVLDATMLMNDGTRWVLGRDLTFSPDQNEAPGYQGALAFSARRSRREGDPRFGYLDIFILDVEIDVAGNLRTGALANLTNTPLVDEETASWHPFGFHLIFERYGVEQDDGEADRSVVVYDFLTDSETLLFPRPLRTHHFAWSPDGNFIAFDSYGEPSINDGYIYYSSPWDPVSSSIGVASDQHYRPVDWDPNWVPDIPFPLP